MATHSSILAWRIYGQGSLEGSIGFQRVGHNWSDSAHMYTSILAWEFIWTEEPGRLQSMGSQKSWTWQRLNNNNLKDDVIDCVQKCTCFLFRIAWYPLYDCTVTCSIFPNWEIFVVFLVFCWNHTKDNFMFINDSTRKTMQNYFEQQRCQKRELWTNSMVTMVTQKKFFSPLLGGYIWIVFIASTGKLLTYWIRDHLSYFAY